MAMGLKDIQNATSIAAGLAIVLLLAYRMLWVVRYPKNLPRVGEREGIPWKTMRQRFQTDCVAVFEEAYQHVRHNPTLTEAA